MCGTGGCKSGIGVYKGGIGLVGDLILSMLEVSICIERRYGGLAQLVRASVSHTEGRRFKSCAPHVSFIE